MPQKSRSAKKTKSSTAQLSDLHRNLLLLFLLLLTVSAFCVFKMDWRLYKDGRNQLTMSQYTEMEGVIHFTALKPEPKDKGELLLFRRRHGSQNWEMLGQPLPLTQDVLWRWDDALPGVIYDLQAKLIIDGKEVKNSEIVTTTAPTYSVEVPLKVTWKDLPEDVVSVSTTKLGGEVVLNGFLSPTTTLEVYALDAQHYDEELFEITPEVLREATLLSRVTKPDRKVEWIWDKAVPLKEYFVVSVLKQNSQIVGVSDQILFAEAGEQQLEQVVNSELQPVAGVSGLWGISSLLAAANTQTSTAIPANALAGTVFIEGPKEKDTSLLMLWRKPGEANYNVVNRYMYPAHQGTDWSWNDAVPGQKYEVMAALQVDEKNTSTAPNPTTVTAPAHHVDFTLNTYYVLPRTNLTPSNQVCIDSDGKNSTAILVLPKMENGTQYWLQVGNNPAEAGIYNQKFPTNDGDIKVRVRVENGKEHFMRYSYATCQNCSSSDNFAPFSDNVGFTCN